VNVIFNRQAAEELRSRYLVLELETFDVNGQKLECFCVVPGDVVPQGDLSDLAQYEKMHQSLVEHLAVKNYPACLPLIENLQGKFGGELDSFYQVISDRIHQTNV